MSASVKRETKETCIDVSFAVGRLRGIEIETGVEIETGIELLDEILRVIGRAGGFDLRVMARGDLETGDHHTVEDVAITLGRAISEEVKSGIGSSMVPSGGSLSSAAVRFGEVGYQGRFNLRAHSIRGMQLENFGHFLRALAYNGGFNLAVCASGDDDMNKIEAICTALGRAIRKASLDGLSR